jgi:hypothetical protein
VFERISHMSESRIAVAPDGELLARGQCISGTRPLALITPNMSKIFLNFRKLECVFVHGENAIRRR